MTNSRRRADIVRVAVAMVAALCLISGCSSSGGPGKSVGSATASVAPSSAASSASAAPESGAGGVPTFSHVIVVVLENKAYSQILGTASAPFLNGLARSGAVLDDSYALTHPSEPNYVALFAGTTHGLSDDSCPHTFTGPNLAAALQDAGHSFVGYSEDLPHPGFDGCTAGDYARKHSPWTNFADLPATVNQPMTAFPTDLAALPTVSFVIPNLRHDMHDGTVADSDRWLRTHLGGYADWATSHNSLLVITGDEDDKSHGNHIATILTGAHVVPGHYAQRVTHYDLLRTLLDSYRLRSFANTSSAAPLTGMWTTTG